MPIHLPPSPPSSAPSLPTARCDGFSFGTCKPVVMCTFHSDSDSFKRRLKNSPSASCSLHKCLRRSVWRAWGNFSMFRWWGGGGGCVTSHGDSLMDKLEFSINLKCCRYTRTHSAGNYNSHGAFLCHPDTKARFGILQQEKKISRM